MAAASVLPNHDALARVAMTDWGDLGPKDKARVSGLFQLIDIDKDGIISYQEVRSASGGDPDGTMQKMFKKVW